MIKRLMLWAVDRFAWNWKYHAGYRCDLLDANPRAAGLLSRSSGLLAVAALLLAIGLAAPVAAHAAVQPTVSPYTLTSRRIAGSLSVVLALIGAIIGGRALARAGNGRGSAILALVLGPIALVSGALVVVTAKGGLGTGNGLAGGVVAVMVALIAMTLGGLALARSRRTG